MNYTEAVKEMINDRKLARDGWAEGTYMEINDLSSLSFTIGTENRQVDYDPTTEDVAATDWKVVG